MIKISKIMVKIRKSKNCKPMIIIITPLNPRKSFLNSIKIVACKVSKEKNQQATLTSSRPSFTISLMALLLELDSLPEILMSTFLS